MQTQSMQWYNEPEEWAEEDGILMMKAAPERDFWRVTKHNFIKDDGHFFYQTVSGNFRAELRFRADYQTLYDQAGLMVRENELTWLKCGVEYLDGVQQASTVITREFSDWSIVPLPDAPEYMWLRLERTGSAVEVFYSVDGESYTLMREGYLSTNRTLQVGPMCASPKGQGFNVYFDIFTLITQS
ncbi:DUF1349 domain-containing protein [Phototrophicus methaneseepsis]|nr:DUF1349 domain-containing protein [Phototrophicus methaneseepsis]